MPKPPGDGGGGGGGGGVGGGGVGGGGTGPGDGAGDDDGAVLAPLPPPQLATVARLTHTATHVMNLLIKNLQR